jgi:hypothetical protein
MRAKANKPDIIATRRITPTVIPILKDFIFVIALLVSAIEVGPITGEAERLAAEDLRIDVDVKDMLEKDEVVEEGCVLAEVIAEALVEAEKTSVLVEVSPSTPIIVCALPSGTTNVPDSVLQSHIPASSEG